MIFLEDFETNPRTSSKTICAVSWLKPAHPMVKNWKCKPSNWNLFSPHFGINNPNIFTKPTRKPRLAVSFCWGCKNLQHSLLEGKNQRKKFERMMVPEKSLTWNHPIKPEQKNHPDPSTFMTLGSQIIFFRGKWNPFLLKFNMNPTPSFLRELCQSFFWGATHISTAFATCATP